MAEAVKILLQVDANVIVLAPKSIKPLVKTKLEFTVNAEPITQPTAAAVRLMVKVPKFKLEAKFSVPILPVPNTVKLEVVLPLKVPKP